MTVVELEKELDVERELNERILEEKAEVFDSLEAMAEAARLSDRVVPDDFGGAPSMQGWAPEGVFTVQQGQEAVRCPEGWCDRWFEYARIAVNQLVIS